MFFNYNHGITYEKREYNGSKGKVDDGTLHVKKPRDGIYLTRLGSVVTIPGKRPA